MAVIDPAHQLAPVIALTAPIRVKAQPHLRPGDVGFQSPLRADPTMEWGWKADRPLTSSNTQIPDVENRRLGEQL
jgi:hypothetical protein